MISEGADQKTYRYPARNCNGKWISTLHFAHVSNVLVLSNHVALTGCCLRFRYIKSQCISNQAAKRWKKHNGEWSTSV